MGWFGVLMDFIVKCKITPGMELFEQYFTEQNIIPRDSFNSSLYILFSMTRTEEGHEKD